MTRADEIKLPGKLRLVPGRQFTATGVRGRLRFVAAVTSDDGAVHLDAFDARGYYRAIAPGRVRTVHAKARPQAGMQASLPPTNRRGRR